MSISERVYWLILITIFTVLAAVIWLILIPYQLIEYNLAINLLTSSVFTVITIVFLSVLFDLRQKAEWKRVKDLVYSKLKTETGVLTSHIFSYIAKTPKIIELQSSYPLFDIADTLPENIEIAMNESFISVVFHEDSFWLFSGPQKELALIQDRYFSFLSSEMVQSLMKIEDYLSDIQSTISIEISQQKNDGELLRYGLNPEPKKRLEANVGMVATKSKMLLLEIKKLRSLIHEK